MKLLAVTSFLVAATAGAAAQITAPMKNYNVTSPLENHPYVVGQILPCTYQLLPDANTVPDLSITLKSVTNTTFTKSIADHANVAKTESAAKQSGNQTYYEYSINYAIPSDVAAGQYKVVYTDETTKTDIAIPVEVRPAASPSATPSTTAPGSQNTGSSSKTGSIFNGGNSMSSPSLTTKTFLALAAVACIALML